MERRSMAVQNFKSISKLPVDLQVWADFKIWCHEHNVTVNEQAAHLITEFVESTRRQS